MVLIFAVTFIFGLCFVQATTDYIREQGDSVHSEVKDFLFVHWGSVSIAMYSLFATALGGFDWDPVATSLHDMDPVMFYLFLFFVSFFFCVITNTLTSLFVEATMHNSAKDHQAIIQ